MKSNRAWAIIVMALAVSIESSEAQPPKPIDGERFRGEWLGTIREKVTGECSMDEDPVDFIVDLKVANDGVLRARTARGKNFEREDEPWEGIVTDSGEVKVTTMQYAICNDKPRKYELKLTGKITSEGATDVLTLEGHNDACPDMGCSSTRLYVLRKRGKASDGRLTMQ